MNMFSTGNEYATLCAFPACAKSVGFLTVTCGNKKGVLDKEKLKRGKLKLTLGLFMFFLINLFLHPLSVLFLPCVAVWGCSV